MVLAAVLAVLTLGDESPSQQAQKKPPPPDPAAAKKAQEAAKKKSDDAAKKAQEAAVRNQEAQVLSAAHVLMAAANHNYGGHRDKAMGHVREAMKILNGSGPHQSMAGPHESHAVSNFLLRQARRLLVQDVRPVAEKKKQGKVLPQVNLAIREIDEALKTHSGPGANTQVKSIEAHVLREAYILMAMSNHDYAGYREKAMGHVEVAVSILDASIMKHGTNGQKVLALKEDIVAARAGFLARYDAALHESQLLSDLQMQVARVLLVNVHFVLNQDKRGKDVLHQVNTAINRINTALTVR
jgi:hypothetical protein